jgi:quinol monooxygenase YgiN
MTVSLFNRMQVKDFDSWLNPNPAEVTQNMKSMGVLAFSLHRNQDDPNSLMLHYQFADEDTAKSFVTGYESMLQEYLKEHPGAEQEILEWWIGEDFDMTPYRQAD